MWKNNTPTTEEIARLARKWMYGTPPPGVRKQAPVIFEKMARKKKQQGVIADAEKLVNIGVNQGEKYITEAPRYHALVSATSSIGTFVDMLKNFIFK